MDGFGCRAGVFFELHAVHGAHAECASALFRGDDGVAPCGQARVCGEPGKACTDAEVCLYEILYQVECGFESDT